MTACWRGSAHPRSWVPCAEDPDVISALVDRGASDYLLPPFRPSDVQPRLRRLLAPRRGPAWSAAETANGGPDLGEFIGESPAFLEQTRKILRIALSDACVLIAGETGTGRELCARAVHYSSPRASCPFVPLNCGAVPVDLLENELFGHAAGAFTSANGSQGGVIREADGGSLFPDEVDALPLSAQVKLLRFLQDKHDRPLAGGKLCKARRTGGSSSSSCANTTCGSSASPRRRLTGRRLPVSMLARPKPPPQRPSRHRSNAGTAHPVLGWTQLAFRASAFRCATR